MRITSSIILLAFVVPLCVQADIGLSEAEKNTLDGHGFVLRKTHETSFTDVYEDNVDGNLPQFVTVDSVLHANHILFDYSLRITELDYLHPAMLALAKRMTDELEARRKALDGQIGKACDAALAYFGVGRKLLDKDYRFPEHIKDIAEKELILIKRRRDIMRSPLFGFKEDYTQYVPRGHYTRNETFRQYFLANMWFGRRNFRFDSDEHILAAAIICGILDDNRDLMEDWKKADATLGFFVGQSDDITPAELIPPIREVYGSFPEPGNLMAGNRFEKLKRKLEDLNPPGIISTEVGDTEEDPAAAVKGFRFLGRRFVPDSYIFRQLVYDRVGTRNKPRLMPSGIDIMSVIGSKRAEKIAVDNGFFEYKNYGKQLEKLREEYPSLKGDNLYSRWMNMLESLFRKPEGPFDFLRSPRWNAKTLLTALGSWAELRHDTVLYAKQSYTVGVTSAPGGGRPEMTGGLIEPYPELFAAAGTLISGLKTRMEDIEIDEPSWLRNLEEFNMLMEDIASISKKQLRGGKPTEDEFRLIWKIGSKLERAVRLEPPLRKRITGDADMETPIVSDVHTDPNSGNVLEAAVGRPLRIIVKHGDDYYSGPVFSYYEFSRPMDKRLTDEEWQSMIEKDKAPGMPDWTGILPGIR